MIREDSYQDFAGFCTKCNTILLKYLSCSLLDALLIGLSNAAFMLIFRILIAIICGGKMFGVVGVLLAIPFAAIVQYLLEEILFPKVREERNNGRMR